MTPLLASQPKAAISPKRRGLDWIVLPAICLLTAGIIAGASEMLARHFFPVRQVAFQNCFASNDPNGDAPVKPNGLCWEQMAESPFQAEYRFNSHGHRADAELAPKQAGTYRIVLIGSSLTQGLFIPREKTFAATLPAQLSAAAGRNVEVYNEAFGGKFRGGPFPTPASAQHFGDILDAQPDLILWVLTPTDLINAMPPSLAVDSHAANPKPVSSPSGGGLLGKVETLFAKFNFADRFKNRWEQTRTSAALKHILLAQESKEEYVQSYLKNEDESGFLQASPGPAWQSRIQNFDADIAELTSRAKAAGVPLAAVYVPNRAQAAMISMENWPAGYDPFHLERELRQAVLSDGETFVDILPDYRGVAGPERHYFPIDGHPDADGHAIVSRFLAKELTSGAVPALKVTEPPVAALEPAK